VVARGVAVAVTATAEDDAAYASFVADTVFAGTAVVRRL